MERKKPGRKRGRAPKNYSRWGFRGMAVRDWLQLLIVPLALAGIGLWFTRRSRTLASNRSTEQRDESTQKLEERRGV